MFVAGLYATALDECGVKKTYDDDAMAKVGLAADRDCPPGGWIVIPTASVRWGSRMIVGQLSFDRHLLDRAARLIRVLNSGTFPGPDLAVTPRSD